jgi:hypothetical protein
MDGYGYRALSNYQAALKVAMLDHFEDGTSGQDRDSYSDDQDRDSYEVSA